MGDIGMIPTPPIRQESLLAAHNLLKELEANESLTDEMKRILADIDSKLSAINLIPETESSEHIEIQRKKELDEVKDKLNSAKEKIMVWESNNSMIWDSGTETALEYIEVVEEVRGFVDRFEIPTEVISQAEDIMQVAMARLEEELVYILEHERQSYVSSEAEDDASEGRITFDLINPEAIPFLRSIKNTMFAAKYDQEFCATYTRVQKEALEDCLIGLGMETVSIEELLKMERNLLDSKVKTWVQVFRTMVQVYLPAEKQLYDQVMGESWPPGSAWFTDIAKSSMTCLLNFGHAVSLEPHTPEKLFYLLDMYEVLVEVHGEVNTLLAGEGGSCLRTEFEEVMERLGDSARSTFIGFGHVILSDPSNEPFPGGGVHLLTSYVMNYIVVYLPDYCKTLNTLLSSEVSLTAEDSPLASHLRSITTNLKYNLEKKSQLYKDVALQHVFLMNNVHYIEQKVIGSELREIFGDEWIKTQIVTYQQHATSYVRTTWSSVVALLKDEGIPSGSGSGVKAILKERIRVFSVAFEEVYRSQTGWIIKDEQLKEELRISISQRVILAYQIFIGRLRQYDIERYIKYNYDDLEDLLNDFFEGSQKSLHYSRRR